MEGTKPSKDRRSEDPSLVVIPLASEVSAVVVDGKAEEWEAADIKEFSGKEFVVKGQSFWRGEDDLSARVGVKGDGNYVYVWVDVKDDTLVAKGGADTLTVWLHDPELATLRQKIPAGFVKGIPESQGVGLRWDPGVSGVSVVGGGREEFSLEELESKKVRTAQGWAVEAKIALEALGQVSSLPLRAVAFALEVSDGDDLERPGPQSVMQVFPGEEKGGAPQFAQVELAGVLPHREATTPQGLGGEVLGFWQVDQGGQSWRYVPLDSASALWRPMHDAQELQQSLRQQPGDVLAGQCAQATHDLHVVKSFSLPQGGQRTALLMCAAREQEGRCPTGSKSTLLLVSLGPKPGGGWEVRKGVRALDAPLAQCLSSPALPEGEETTFYDRFSMLPLDFLDDEMWAVGWRLTMRGSQVSESSVGVTFLTLGPGAKGSDGFLAEVWPWRLRSHGTDQSLDTSQFYFVQLDGKKGLDLCEVQTRIWRACQGFERGCAMALNGLSRHTQIKMWNPKRRALEESLNPAHKRCLYDFSKAPVDGYILVHTGSQVGLLKMEK